MRRRGPGEVSFKDASVIRNSFSKYRREFLESMLDAGLCSYWYWNSFSKYATVTLEYMLDACWYWNSFSKYAREILKYMLDALLILNFIFKIPHWDFEIYAWRVWDIDIEFHFRNTSAWILCLNSVLDIAYLVGAGWGGRYRNLAQCLAGSGVRAEGSCPRREVPES